MALFLSDISNILLCCKRFNEAVVRLPWHVIRDTSMPRAVDNGCKDRASIGQIGPALESTDDGPKTRSQSQCGSPTGFAATADRQHSRASLMFSRFIVISISCRSAPTPSFWHASAWLTRAQEERALVLIARSSKYLPSSTLLNSGEGVWPHPEPGQGQRRLAFVGEGYVEADDGRVDHEVALHLTVLAT